MKNMNVVKVWIGLAIEVIGMTAIELAILLNLHPAKYYFTLPGLKIVSICDIVAVAIMLPQALYLEYKTNFLEESTKMVRGFLFGKEQG